MDSQSKMTYDLNIINYIICNRTMTFCPFVHMSHIQRIKSEINCFLLCFAIVCVKSNDTFPYVGAYKMCCCCSSVDKEKKNCMNEICLTLNFGFSSGKIFELVDPKATNFKEFLNNSLNLIKYILIWRKEREKERKRDWWSISFQPNSQLWAGKLFSHFGIWLTLSITTNEK